MKKKIISYKLLEDYKKDISESVMRGIKEFKQWRKEYKPEQPVQYLDQKGEPYYE